MSGPESIGAAEGRNGGVGKGVNGRYEKDGCCRNCDCINGSDIFGVKNDCCCAKTEESMGIGMLPNMANGFQKE
jgi:hypothetical protein